MLVNPITLVYEEGENSQNKYEFSGGIPGRLSCKTELPWNPGRKKRIYYSQYYEGYYDYKYVFLRYFHKVFLSYKVLSTNLSF